MKYIIKRIVMIFVLCMTITNVLAYDFAVENEDGVIIYYNLITLSLNNSTIYQQGLEVTYRGSQTVFYGGKWVSKPVPSYKGHVKIPSSVVVNNRTFDVICIGENAFTGCEGLLSVVIPNSILCVRQSENFLINKLYISDMEAWCNITFTGTLSDHVNYLLFNDNVIEDLVIPYGITKIKHQSFRGYRLLKSVSIPNTVTSIDYYAFADCRGLTSITIPNSVKKIDTGAFSGCTSLTSVSISDSVTEFGSEVFRGCTSLHSITLPNNMTETGWYTFKNCSNLTSVTLPNSLKSIGREVFYGCTNLTTITIPSSVNKIGDKAFAGCHVKTVVSLIGNPPEISKETFDVSIYKNSILYVPTEKTYGYRHTRFWSDFIFIEEGIPNGLRHAHSDNASIKSVYQIDGKRTKQQRDGISIIKYSNGTTKKVLNK